MTTDHIRSKPQSLAIPFRVARGLFGLLAWLFVAGVVLQFFFAGLALLVDGSQIALHEALGYLLLPLTFVLVLSGLAGRLPWRTVGLAAALIPLLVLQYTFVHLPVASDVGVLRALHPVNALVLFWVGLHAARLR